MAKPWVVMAGLGGLLAVILGAAGQHLLAGNDAAVHLVDTASRYLMFHSLALLGIAALWRQGASLLLRVAASFFVVGMVLFGGGIATLAFTGIAGFGMAAPVGGIAFMLGWASLVAYGLKS